LEHGVRAREEERETEDHALLSILFRGLRAPAGDEDVRLSAAEMGEEGLTTPNFCCGAAAAPAAAHLNPNSL
jgi:hypothetical protein